MPLPKPNTGEMRDDFMNRCMANLVMNNEYPDKEQRYAVCNTQWEGKKMEKKIKYLDYQIKDLDEPKGIVQFYANSFDKKDDDGDIIVKGAFKKTLQENEQRIKHLLDHDTSIGVTKSISEDSFGLDVVSQMIMKKQAGRETFEEYIVYASLNKSMEHSIRISDMKSEEDKDREARIIKEARLWDVSTITKWGANQWTPQGIIKKFKSISDAIEALELMLKGKFSEEKLKNIDKVLSKLKSLIDEPPSTQIDEPIDINAMLNECELFKI